MKACCCSMAGTRACDTCSNGPSNYMREVAYSEYHRKPQQWIVKTSPEPLDYEKIVKEMLKQIKGD